MKYINIFIPILEIQNLRHRELICSRLPSKEVVEQGIESERYNPVKNPLGYSARKDG